MIRLLLVLLVLCYSSMVCAGSIVFIKGDVTINHKKAKKGDRVVSKNLIETTANSLAIIKTAGGHTFKLGEKSSLRVDENVPGESAELDAGQLFIYARKILMDQAQKQQGLKVIMRNVSMGVRGTKFFVAQGKSGTEDVWMCVQEGQVWIKHAKEEATREVKAGEGVAVRDGKTSRPKALPWTQKLNWNFDPDQGDLENKISIEEAYGSPDSFDYQ